MNLDISFGSISFDFRIGRNDADYDSIPLLIDYSDDESGEDHHLETTIGIHDETLHFDGISWHA